MYNNIMGRIHSKVKERVLERLEEFDVDDFVDGCLSDSDIDDVISEVLLDKVDLEEIAQECAEEEL